MNRRRSFCRLAFASVLVLCASSAVNQALADEAEFRIFDGFDKEQFTLEWETVRPDEENTSLTKNPGKLTITTDFGTLGYDEVKRGPAKNLHLVKTPKGDGSDFVVTTCIESFEPSAKYQQAALLIYDDDDNYLKYGMQFSNGGVEFKHMREANQFRIISNSKQFIAVPKAEKIWLRLIKRGNVYERAYSVDGKEFKMMGEETWGDGEPSMLGLMAANGTSTEEHCDAQFDFFEVRSLNQKEANDPRFLEREKLTGAWEVIEAVADGAPLEESYSEFLFEGGSVVFVEATRTISVDYTLDLNADPKRISMAAFARGTKGAMNGSYKLDGDSLTICLSLNPNEISPDKLESKKGDGRLLLKLKKSSEKKAEAPTP